MNLSRLSEAKKARQTLGAWGTAPLQLSLVIALACAACSKSTPAAEVTTPAEEVVAPVAEVATPAGEVAAAPDVAPAAPDVAAASPDVAGADAAAAPDVAVVPDVAAVADVALVDVPKTEARPVPPIGIYASAEDALLAYLEGTRKQDPERLWSVMSVEARALMAQVLGKAKAAPEPELAKIGLTRGALESMTAREFFDHMVRQAPKPDPQELVGALKTELAATPDRMLVSFTLGAAPGETRPSRCQADAVKDAEGWKIEVSHCTSGP